LQKEKKRYEKGGENLRKKGGGAAVGSSDSYQVDVMIEFGNDKHIAMKFIFPFLA
jgi:hypothetical protein